MKPTVGRTQKYFAAGTKGKGTYDRNLEHAVKREQKWLEALQKNSDFTHLKADRRKFACVMSKLVKLTEETNQ